MQVEAIREPVRMAPAEGDLARLFRDFFFGKNPLGMMSEGIWRPPTDVYETGDAVVVRMEIPGIRTADVAVTLTGSILRVRGCRHDPEHGIDRKYHCMEVHYGYFERSVHLHHPVSAKGAEWRYENGFVVVRVPTAKRAGRAATLVIRFGP